MHHVDTAQQIVVSQLGRPFRIGGNPTGTPTGMKNVFGPATGEERLDRSRAAEVDLLTRAAQDILVTLLLQDAQNRRPDQGITPGNEDHRGFAHCVSSTSTNFSACSSKGWMQPFLRDSSSRE